RRRAGVLLAVLGAQGGVGYLQYFTGVPPALVAVHLLGAALVWTALLRVHLAIAPVRARAGAMTRPSDAAGSGATTRAPAPVLSKG
ncbi:MAG: heme A synthase, partial [Acidimicrobiales bacterium]